jgi:hypothetical protein
VVFLVPGKKHDHLEGSMIVCNFPDVTLNGWDALSYTWGDSSELAGIITIDDRKMKITANLEIALRGLRHETELGFLWIDAICTYSHRTATKHLGSLRFAPQFFEGFNFTHLASQNWQYIFPFLILLFSPTLGSISG